MAVDFLGDKGPLPPDINARIAAAFGVSPSDVFGPGGSLAGTLTGQAVMSQMEQLGRLQVEHLTKQREGAAKAAGDAEDAYTQAAAQAPPDVAPGDQFIQTLLGNVASTIAQDPKFRQSAQERILNQRNALMKARAENLTALRDVYGQRATELEKMGDPAALDMRVKMDQLDKQMEQLLEKQKLDARSQSDRDQRAHEIELEKMKQAGRLFEEQFKFELEGGEGAVNDEIDSYATALVSGELPSPTNVPSKIRGQVLRRIKERGEVILPPKVRESVGALGAANSVLDQIEALSQQINTEGPEGRVGQGLDATVGGLTQERPEVAVYNSMRNGLLSAISRATGEVGVLTDADVARARNLLPNVWDSEEVAKDKIHQLRQYFRVRNFQLKRAYTTPGAGIEGEERSEAPTAEVGWTRDANGKLVRK